MEGNRRPGEDPGERAPLLRRLVAAAAIATAVAMFARRWLDAVEVRGESMAPTLLPGDLLLVERLTFTRRAPRPGDVILAPDPRLAERELMKRVAAVDPQTGEVELRGDAPERSTDSRTFGRVPGATVSWRVVARYWPATRLRRF